VERAGDFPPRTTSGLVKRGYDMDDTAKQLLDEIVRALIKDGYDPCQQIQCYLDSGSDAFITHRDHAREKIKFLMKEDIEEYLAKLPNKIN